MRWIIFTTLLLAIAGLAGWFFSRPGAEQLNRADALYSLNSKAVQVAQDLSFANHPRLSLDIWTPADTPPDASLPVLVFFYGGSWYFGEKHQYGFLARAYTELGYIVVLPDYRLYPDVRFPEMARDAAAAIAWTHDNIADHGGDPGSIVIAGHSAGAYNALMAALDPQWLAAHGKNTDIIRGVTSLAGPADFYPFTSEAAQNSFGEAPDPEATQPISFARADAPPLLLLSGTEDTTVRPRNSEALQARMEATGGQSRYIGYDGVDHSDIIMAVSRPFRNRAPVLEDSHDFFRSVLDPSQGLAGDLAQKKSGTKALTH
ncbi:MAG: alpha/beta hydrolase [Pseudomonadota bacterium]